MAPIKNSHSSYNNHNTSNNYIPNTSANNNTSSHQNRAGGPTLSASTTIHRKHTGTVPKATAPVVRVERDASQEAKTSLTVNASPSEKAIKTAAKRPAAFLLQQTQQQQQPSPPFVNERSSPFSILTAAQQSQQHHHHTAQQQLQQQQSQQQLQQQLQQPQQQSQQQLQQQQLLLQPQQQQNIHQRKNTEVVAPIRRELKDLNDYILSAVVTTTNNNSKNQRFHQQHQNKQYNYSKPHQQLQVHESNSLNSGIEIDTILDNHSRIFYPVRPIPRRNLQQLNDTATNDFGNGSSYPAAATTTTTTNLNLLNHPAAIGVVIPTTPGIANNSGAGSNNSNSYNSYALAATNEEDIVNANNFAETITSANIRGYSNNINNINNNSNIISNNSTFTINQQQLLLQQLQQQIEEQSSHLLVATNSPQQQKLQKQQHQQLESVTSTITSNLLDLDGAGVIANSSSVETGTATDTDINLLQRLQLIQQLLALNAKPNPVAASPGSSQLTDTNRHTNMVNEVRSPTVTERDVIVNSSSLEDVATSEINDNRAQSITSLHSALEETPTPTDNGPSYAELQLRLELSNRNIQNMQEQQKQLLRLQQQAKLHLNEMETIRQGAPLSCGQQNGNDSNNPPDYQSIQQVHSDMSSLVGRMKNLTTFIQHQNELGNLLGDDGPDILAEQEALQRKLQSLRMQRDEMRNLVGELQDIHRDAELTVEKRKQDNEQHRQPSPQQQLQQSLRQGNNVVTDVADASLSSNERIVPIEYSRIVPTELVPPKGRVVSLVDAEDSAAAEMIRQKVADIAAMKAQLSRLKNMMETVNLIEEHTARTEPTDVGRVSGVASAIDIPVQRERSLGGYERDRSDSYDRERTPTAGVMNDQENELISAKVRILNEVTSDLRAQALSLQAERDRIKVLKDEIVRRKAEAAAAAQMGEDALKSHSLTPTPQIQRRVAEEQAERELIKEEYAVKKKEFEELCQHLGQNEGCNASTPAKTLQQNQANGIRDLVSEADDEAEPEEEPTDSDFGVTAAVTTKYYPAQASNSIEISAKRVIKNTSAMNVTNQRGSKRSTEESTAAANVADIPNETAGSMEAASIKSGSSQSLSMPPPMHPINGTNLTSNWLPGPIPPPLPAPWNPQYYYGSSSAQPSATSFTPPQCIASMNHHHQHHPSISNNVECICNASLNVSTLGAPVNTTNSGDTSGATNGSVSFNTDPMMFQQFVQTQQMLINSVCQCNQMLWHQQREIDALNNAIHVLQNRLLSLGGPPTADLGFDIRAESVPPPNSLHTGSQHSNNLYAAMQTRSQSEQPAAAFLPLTCSVGCANYQQQHQIHHQHVFQRRQQQRSALGYNYGNEMQQNANTSTSIYTALNNAAPAAPPPPPPQFNNEAPPQSPSIASAAGGPGPIFMHHHNNTIHQNNANLRTQNHHANNLLQQQQQQHSNLAVNASNTLNNQVPPGNRANNYWDNFRSYSRQNLLSTNSNKSNEDQNQQQMQQQELDQQYQPPPAHHLPIPAMQQQQPQQQQLQPPSQSLYQQRQINQNNHGSPTDCNNLNYESNNTTRNTNNTSCNKYMRSLQRNRINQLQQQQHVGSMLPNSDANNVFQTNAPAAARELLQNLNWHSNTSSATVVDEDNDLFELYNIAYINDMSTTYTGSAAPGANARNMNNMNMNVNFGNNMQNQRNKVPAKPTCRSATSLHRANLQMAAAIQQDQQQHYVNAAETQSYDLLTNRTASEQQPPHSLSAPPSTQSIISIPVAALTTRNPEEFVLCPVDVADGFKSVSTTTDDADFVADSVAAHTEKEDDDTTSEEIKRNLLVNALKNDKFTTKFYESIKEDVFRRLESLLLEKDTTERPGARAEQTSLQQQPHYLTQNVNDVGGGATRDPTHKLYLNAQMGTRHQQHPVEISASADRAELDGKNIAEETESNNADDNDLSETSEAISSGVIESLFNVVAVGNMEDEEPEENGNQGHKYNRHSAAAFSLPIPQASATTINKSTIRNAAIVHPIGTRLPFLGELKNQCQQPQTANGNAITEEAQPAIFTIITNQENNIESKNLEYRTPDFELLNYIITRIQNQTKPDTLVDDTVLVEVAKLTSKAAQNSNATKLADAAKAAVAGGGDNSLASIHQQQALNISPKKIYSKIKKLSNVPRQRDQFLKWYHSYMETLLYVCNNNNDNNNNFNIKCSVRDKKYKHNQQNVAIRNKQPPGLDNFNNINSQRKLQNETGIIAPYTNSASSSCSISSTTSSDNNNANHISITNADNLSVNDADLAEADQICSPNTSVSNQDDDVSGFVVVNNIAVKIEQHVSFEANHTPQIKEENRVDELENNENPEEEGAAAAAICNALLLESNDKTKQNGLKQEEDKLNMTDIKIEPNITELQQTNDLNKSGLEGQDSNIDHSNGKSDAAETTKYSVVRPSISTSTTVTTTKKDLMKHMNGSGVA